MVRYQALEIFKRTIKVITLDRSCNLQKFYCKFMNFTSILLLSFLYLALISLTLLILPTLKKLLLSLFITITAKFFDSLFLGIC